MVDKKVIRQQQLLISALKRDTNLVFVGWASFSGCSLRIQCLCREKWFCLGLKEDLEEVTFKLSTEDPDVGID